jgi:hypothetical protein
MTVSTFLQSDISGQSGAAWFPTVDGDISVMARIAAAFAPHQTSLASMAVAIDKGAVLVDGTLLEVAAQTSPALTVPASNPRIDRVVLDRTTGIAAVVMGAEATNPVAPALPIGALPIAQVRLEPDTISVTNAMVTDERILPAAKDGVGNGVISVKRFTANATYVPTPGTKTVIVEVQGGGGSGGGCPATNGSQGSASAGGSAGSYGRSIYTVDFSSVAVTVGAGGASPAAGANLGNNGSVSSFGDLLICPGGFGALAGVASANSVIGGAGTASPPTGANIIGCPGSQGGHGICVSPSWVVGGTGGASYFGGGGFAGVTSSGGNAPALGAGGGGSGAQASNPARSAGKGGDGLVIVYEFG